MESSSQLTDRPIHCPAPCGASPCRARGVPSRPWIGPLLQEVEHSLGEGLRLLDIGNVRGVEFGQLGALDLLRDLFAPRRRRRRIMLADNDERRLADAR